MWVSRYFLLQIQTKPTVLLEVYVSIMDWMTSVWFITSMVCVTTGLSRLILKAARCVLINVMLIKGKKRNHLPYSRFTGTGLGACSFFRCSNLVLAETMSLAFSSRLSSTTSSVNSPQCLRLEVSERVLSGVDDGMLFVVMSVPIYIEIASELY